MSADAEAALRGARNMVRNAGLIAGQSVLVHAERDTDGRLVDVIWAALAEHDVNVAVMRTDHWDKLRDEPPEVFRTALAAVDVLISTGEFLRALDKMYLKKAMYDDGLFYLHNEASTFESMGSDYAIFPLELVAAIGTYVTGQLRGSRLRLTTPAGTDLEMTVRPETIGGYWYPYRYDAPGHKKAFPGGAYAFYPEGPVDGVLAIEAIPRHAVPLPSNHLERPLMLTIQDHRVTGMDGPCAEWLSDYWLQRGDENSNWLGKVALGIHPKARSPEGRGACNPAIINVGFGNSTQYGGPVFSRSWTRAYVQEPTLTADGVPVIDRGHLCALDAEPIRRLAEELGCEASALDQVPQTLADLTDL
ncbi:MAG TPA: hypothetical protein VGM84_09285 [Steroidobacteraceae bacterium]|jgi:hypothetical protein